MLREKRPITDVAPAADHDQIHGRETALARRGNDVDVARRRALDELARLQGIEPRDLVADLGRLLKGERSGRRFHLLLQDIEHLGRLALKK